ncbi:hypothetical protein CCACVL1_22601, partial [Corchorus capsularis]
LLVMEAGGGGYGGGDGGNGCDIGHTTDA